MKKLPKEIYVLAGVALVLCLVIGFMSMKTDKGGTGTSAPAAQSQGNTATEETTASEFVADVEAIALPEKSEMEEVLGFEPVQVDRLTDLAVLRYVYTNENNVEYWYQQHLAANGQRLILRIEPMSEEAYKESLPMEGVAVHLDIAERDVVFADRTLFKIPEGQEPGDYELGMVAEGTAVIEEGDIFMEAINMQTAQWYENGCAYELHAERWGFTAEEMEKLLQYYFDNAK